MVCLGNMCMGTLHNGDNDDDDDDDDDDDVVMIMMMTVIIIIIIIIPWKSYLWEIQVRIAMGTGTPSHSILNWHFTSNITGL